MHSFVRYLNNNGRYDIYQRKGCPRVADEYQYNLEMDHRTCTKKISDFIHTRTLLTESQIRSSLRYLNNKHDIYLEKVVFGQSCHQGKGQNNKKVSMGNFDKVYNSISPSLHLIRRVYSHLSCLVISN